MQEVFRVACASEGEFVLIAPDILAHNEDTNGRRAGIIVLQPLQRVVKPLKRSARHVQHRVSSEHDITHLSFC